MRGELLGKEGGQDAVVERQHATQADLNDNDEEDSGAVEKHKGRNDSHAHKSGRAQHGRAAAQAVRKHAGKQGKAHIECGGNRGRYKRRGCGHTQLF